MSMNSDWFAKLYPAQILYDDEHHLGGRGTRRSGIYAPPPETEGDMAHVVGVWGRDLVLPALVEEPLRSEIVVVGEHIRVPMVFRPRRNERTNLVLVQWTRTHKLTRTYVFIALWRGPLHQPPFNHACLRETQQTHQMFPSTRAPLGMKYPSYQSS